MKHTKPSLSIHSPQDIANGGDPQLALDQIAAADDSPDAFLQPVLDCFRLIGRATLILLGGVLTADLASLAAALKAPGWLWLGVGALAGALVLIAIGMLASIQVRYTFEHAHMHKRHFYALKLARFREACAALQSLALSDAVPAVHALQDLRRQTGLLDRRLAIETLMLRRRWRDLTWFPRAGVAAGCGCVAVELVETGTFDETLTVPGALVTGGLLIWAAVEHWAGNRVARVRELLSPSPPELSAAFNPSPHMEATVERLLTRINRHFDRLKGQNDLRLDTLEEEMAT